MNSWKSDTTGSFGLVFVSSPYANYMTSGVVLTEGVMPQIEPAPGWEPTPFREPRALWDNPLELLEADPEASGQLRQ